LLARSYLEWGLPAETPELGAIAVLSRGRDPALGHVGFLVGLTDEQVILLGGNQSDAVSVEAFERSRLLGLRLPRTAQVTERVPASKAEATFAWSLTRVLELEGGFTDDPFDPGGPTNKGVTLATYARFKGEALTQASYNRLKAELRAIPDTTVSVIYRDRYWQPGRCPDLPPALAHFHFDASVNQGVGGATRMLQEALGVAIDGEIGPITLGAAFNRPLSQTLERYAAARRRRYRALQHFWRFGRGWLSRVDKVLAQSLALASQTPRDAERDPASEAVPANPSEPPEINPMPDATQPFPAPSTETKWWGNSMTIWGALVTAVSTVAPAVLFAFGVDLPSTLIEQLGTDIAIAAQAIGGLVGTIMTIVGRARASTPLARRGLTARA
jgi:lysozyme family protein